jgi:threonine aldolase
MFKGIDLFSDTLTQPTAAMKQAMIEAPLGDEQKGEDPTTRALEEKVAKLLGQEAALFFPSATMANEIAIRLHCEPGDELIAAENCHLFIAEAGGPAIHSGVMTRPIATETGVFTAEMLKNTYRRLRGPHYPISKLVSIENTTNMGGGIAWDMTTLKAVLNMAKQLQLKIHLDGARLFNAVIKTGVKPAEITSEFDSVTLCLSKGLGCPVGAVLTFKQEHFAKVRRLKQLYGGALRQSGMLTAAGLYALDHHVERLAEDHANTARLAARLAEIPSIVVENNPPSTNMVFFKCRHTKMAPAEFNEQCLAKGVRFSQVDDNRFRAVVHLNIAEQDIDKAVELVKSVVG